MSLYYIKIFNFYIIFQIHNKNNFFNSWNVFSVKVFDNCHYSSHEKKAAPPVNMSKLLGFGYAEEENKSLNDDDASSETSCFLL